MSTPGMSAAMSLQMVKTSREQAEYYILNNKPGRAFAHFLVVFTLNPSLRGDPDLKELFLATLCTWGQSLEQDQRFGDLVQSYKQALNIFPENEEILNNLGSHSLRLHDVKSACSYYRRALKTKPDFLPATRNLQRACNSVVERWHFGMLNDQNRNEAFRRAIAKRVHQGFRQVLDIGTGSGILSLLAVEAGATHVFACDCSTTMIQVASDVMKANNADSSVTLLRLLSYELTIPEHLPQRVSLVVTETFDAGAFGEGVLQTLLHAWEELLLPPHPALLAAPSAGHVAAPGCLYGAVVPHGLVVWLAGVECRHVAERNRVVDPPLGLRLPRVRREEGGEPYDAEDMRRVPGGFRFVTERRAALSVNLNSKESITAHLSDRRTAVTLRCTAPGRLDAVVAWFQLTLDGDVMLSTGPDRDSCWDQAVFPADPVGLEVGTEVQLQVGSAGGKLCVRVVGMGGTAKGNEANENCERDDDLCVESDVNEGMSSRHYSEPSEAVETFDGELKITNRIKTADELEMHERIQKCSIDECENNDEIVVPEGVLRLLNDSQYIDALECLSDTLGNNLEQVLDLSLIPVLGIKLLKMWPACHLTCLVSSENETSTLLRIAESNDVHDRVRFISDISEIEGTFDVIVNDVLDACGEMKEDAVNRMALLRRLLKPDTGRLLPEAVTVCCQLVSCDWLGRVSAVQDDALTCGYQIGCHVNAYQSSVQLDLNLSSLQHTPLSAPLPLLALDLLDPSPELLRTSVVRTTHAGAVNAVACWYELRWLRDGPPLSTLHPASHLRQVAFLVRPALEVEQGQEVNVTIHYQRGIFNITSEAHS